MSRELRRVAPIGPTARNDFSMTSSRSPSGRSSPRTPVSTYPCRRYSAIAGALSGTTSRRMYVAPCRAAHSSTAATSWLPSPWPRTCGLTHSECSHAQPSSTTPRTRPAGTPSRTATTFSAVVSSTRSRQRVSPPSAHSADAPGNASGASASAASRRSGSDLPPHRSTFFPAQTRLGQQTPRHLRATPSPSRRTAYSRPARRGLCLTGWPACTLTQWGCRTVGHPAGSVG
jgi:hypothetical protein